MTKIVKQKAIKIGLILVMLTMTIYTRFLNLNWDRGFGLHPDENNLWGASRQVKLFTQLDPNFYAYGGFPIYVYSLLEHKVQARTISAAVQTFIVLLLFFLGKKFAGWSGGISSAAMGTFSAGLVQAAHFLTVESLIGFFSLLLFFCMLRFHELNKTMSDRASFYGKCAQVTWLAIASVVLGLGIGTKVSFAVFVLPFLVVLRPGLVYDKAGPLKIVLQKTFPFIVFFLVLSLVFLVFLLVNPYVFSRWESVRSILTYEMNIAAGKLPVFYTREFINTIPGWFQAIYVFPYITGWLFLPMFLIGLLVVFFKVRPWRTPRSNLLILLAIAAALLSFVPFWAKWTRYVVQVLPILVLTAGIGASWLWKRGLFGRLFVAAAMIAFLPPFFSMLSVYQHQDARLAASKWASSHIDGRAKIFAEAMDLGIVPFNPSLGKQISLFNFYDLDADKTGKEQEALQSLVDESDYFISVSERVYGNSLRRPDLFPRSASFYNSLFDRSLGYEKIYDSSSIVIPGSDQESIYIDSGSEFTPPKAGAGMTGKFPPEETFSVFDHPRVMIFAKDSMK